MPARPIRRPIAVAALLVTTGLVPPGAQAGGHDPVIVAVGDLACQSLPQGRGTATCQSGRIADLIREIDPDRFLALGDLQYNNAKLSEILRVWDTQFGDLLDITSPAPGNHEYGTSGAAGYFEYFGERANPDGTDPPTGYYSFDLGEWHLVSLNSDACGDDPGCGPGTPQYRWLARDLANSDAGCTLAYMHHPRYDWRPWQKWVDEDATTLYGGSEVKPLIPLWDLMYDQGVDVVLSAHNHLYQRWAPQDGRRNVVDDGAVQFTVGTGGRSLYPFGRPPRPDNLEVTQNDAYGLLQMTLHDASYTYEWVSAEGQPAFEDTGTVACS
jgi:hypothetical protein